MNEQISFSEIERVAKLALESGDLNKLETILVPLTESDDKSRSASENLFLHRTLGQMYWEMDKKEDAWAAFEHARLCDPRDFDTLNSLVEKELKKSPDQVNTGLLLDFLIFHRPKIKDSTVMRMFKVMGDGFLAGNELDQARECYEKALDACPGEMDIINALLKVSQDSGDEQALAKSREKLLDSMTAPESRAAVFVSIGDDYLNRKNDEKSAFAMYEEALAECAQSTAAYQRILEISNRAEDWDHSLNALNALVKYSREDAEKSRYLLEMARIFIEKLNNSKRAIQLFNEVLDIQPERLDVFKGMVSILQSQNDYKAIDANYERMIERLQAITPQNTKLIAGLSKNLGELRFKQFNDIRGAAKAYQLVSDLFPDIVNIHIYLAKFYAAMDDTTELAVRENREILRLDPAHVDAVPELAKCYRKLGKYDEALCIYRVLSVLGINSEEGKAIVAKFADTEIPRITAPIKDELWKYIIPKPLDRTLMQIFSIAVSIISERFSNDPSTYGINEKDARIDVSENSIFVNTLRNETQALGYGDHIPNVYRCDKFKGVTNAFFTPPSLLVNSNFLKSRTEREIAFASSKALLMLRPEFYLLPLGLPSLQLILKLILKVIDPSLNINLDKNSATVAKTLENGLTPEKRTILKEKVQELTGRGSSPDLRRFMESVEDFGNRIGLLFCDDPSIIQHLLTEEKTISTRSAKDRVGSLLLWALSEDYTTLRKELGISLKG